MTGNQQIGYSSSVCLSRVDLARGVPKQVRHEFFISNTHRNAYETPSNAFKTRSKPPQNTSKKICRRQKAFIFVHRVNTFVPSKCLARCRKFNLQLLAVITFVIASAAWQSRTIRFSNALPAAMFAIASCLAMTRFFEYADN